jgi:NCS1 family nucleobase:cation symporter-1
VGQWVSFAIFWVMNVYFIIKGTESIRWLESLSAPFLIIVGLALLLWAYNRGGGWGPILSQPGKFQSTGEFWKFFVPSLTGMVGFWATLSLNIPDFSRYAKSQRAQIAGQAIGLPPTMTLYAFIGVAVTSATIVIFGEAIWDPVALLAKFKNPLIIVLSMISLIVATLTTNIAANVVSPANDFSNLFPKKINFKTGGLITAVIGVAMMPWKLLSDYGTYIFVWLVGYSSFLGPIAGVLIADYFVIRKRQLIVKDLYIRNGEYEFTRGFNWRAIAALLAGVAVALIGLVVGPLRFLYDYAWFVGFAVAFGVYAVMKEPEKLRRMKISG